MSTGDITDEYDKRKSCFGGTAPVCGLTLEIVVADGTSEKEEELDETLHPCMNCLLTDIYLEAPAIATAAKTIRLELLTERDSEIFTTGDLDATSAEDHARHTQRLLKAKTGIKVVCDAVVNGAKTFYVEVRGV